MGAGRTLHDATVAPDLMEHLAKSLEGDALILKLTRKSREESAVVRK